MESQYARLKSGLLRSGRLFEDAEFPAIPRSLYFSKNDPSIYWQRPTELIRYPKFIVGSASRFDLDQGLLGDCWYVAAVSTLATRPELFKRVPTNQPSNQPASHPINRPTTQTGIFHFNFWFYGEWKEVIIDDRLPTSRGKKLVFCSSREHPDEFWSALLEKAYAKLAGSYEALDGGWIEDALVDFTGGISQRISLRDTKRLPRNFFNVLLQNNMMNSLMGTCIYVCWATRLTMEKELDNGLFVGHAYSITEVLQVRFIGSTFQLLRLRNPWGRLEWRGKWSDKSKEWMNLNDRKRSEIGLIIEEDGEFWISFEDVMRNFDVLQICHLPPSCEILKDKKPWIGIRYNGTWTRGVNSGGSDYFRKHGSYWTNSQYSIQLANNDDNSNKCCIIISLMQKHSKMARTQLRVQYTEIPLLFDLYKVVLVCWLPANCY
ncbi:hypothetical protein HELRODRAFT_66381 [Helobdella robusta]|uniref:Calpain catalytic domain-containing protein n=1 Tax=Helobdella robusta TaxID=6412 RepID=T1FYK4_HELRO|nr:hypothetical protein HELRODRAFT_66381 [Helobdella robusta]ESO02633.1 hypothetical protein HELRODRAFT_66381 [Helobdella robusta]